MEYKSLTYYEIIARVVGYLKRADFDEAVKMRIRPFDETGLYRVLGGYLELEGGVLIRNNKPFFELYNGLFRNVLFNACSNRGFYFNGDPFSGNIADPRHGLVERVPIMEIGIESVCDLGDFTNLISNSKIVDGRLLKIVKAELPNRS